MARNNGGQEPESMEDTVRQGCNLFLFFAGALAASGDVFTKRLGTAGSQYYGAPQIIFGIVALPWLFIAFAQDPKAARPPPVSNIMAGRASVPAQWNGRASGPRTPQNPGRPGVHIPLAQDPKGKSSDNPAGLAVYWIVTLGWLIVHRAYGAAKRANGYDTHSLHIGISLFPGNHPAMLEVVAMFLASFLVGVLTESTMVMTYMWFVAGGMAVRNMWLQAGRKARVRRMKDAAWDAREFQNDLREAGGW